RRLEADPDVYRQANRHFYLLLGEAVGNGESTDQISILRKMSDPEITAYVRYHEYDKKYPKVFDRNGFIEA
ncbi:MAG: hypothetical protein IJ087_14755, partial [Eggerthellaceae bacterium]|nr:hypothetical protein [Eggerthellaceae bacterium]